MNDMNDEPHAKIKLVYPNFNLHLMAPDNQIPPQLLAAAREFAALQQQANNRQEEKVAAAVPKQPAPPQQNNLFRPLRSPKRKKIEQGTSSKKLRV